MNLPEGFPPLDDLLPTNPAVYEAPNSKDLGELFTNPDSPIWSLNSRPYTTGVQPLFKQGYYTCLVEVMVLTGLAVSGLFIEVAAIDAVVEVCKRYDRMHKFAQYAGCHWLTIGFPGQKSWDEPIPEKHFPGEKDENPNQDLPKED